VRLEGSDARYAWGRIGGDCERCGSEDLGVVSIVVHLSVDVST
jgi:hypothetical protein